MLFRLFLLQNSFRLFTGGFVIACMVKQDSHANGRGEQTRNQAGKEVTTLLVGTLICLVLAHQIGQQCIRVIAARLLRELCASLGILLLLGSQLCLG